MAFNGSGTFNRIYNWVQDKTNSIKITASRFDTEMDGMATGLSTCITKDGQTTISENIPFNSKKITVLGNATNLTDAINAGQVQNGSFNYFGSTGGDADNLTLSPSPAITSSSIGFFTFQAGSTCNADCDLNISARGVKTLKKFDGTGSKINLESDDLISGQRYIAFDDSTDIVIFNPEKPYIKVVNLDRATTTERGVSYLPKPITITNNISDPNNDIDFGAGNFQFSDGSGQATISALTKQLNASWVAGNNQGGLFSGSKASDTTYYLFSIYNPTTFIADAGFDTSVIAANIPSGYTKYSLLGSVTTDGSGNISNLTKTSELIQDLFNQSTLDSSSSDVSLLTKVADSQIKNFVIKTGVFTSNSDANIAVSFAEAFENACIGVIASGQDATVSADVNWTANGITASGFNSNRDNEVVGTYTLRYLAIGY